MRLWACAVAAAATPACLLAIVTWQATVFVRDPETRRRFGERRAALVASLEIENSGPMVRGLAAFATSRYTRVAGRLALKAPIFLGAYLLFGLLNAVHGLFRGLGDDVAPFAPVDASAFDSG